MGLGLELGGYIIEMLDFLMVIKMGLLTFVFDFHQLEVVVVEHQKVVAPSPVRLRNRHHPIPHQKDYQADSVRVCECFE